VEAFEGHFLISFMAIIISLHIQSILKDSKYNASFALYEFKNLYCNIYKDKIFINKPNKKIKEIISLFNIDLPSTLSM
jgi:hypothetical protein